jgi:hypothetical protein
MKFIRSASLLIIFLCGIRPAFAQQKPKVDTSSTPVDSSRFFTFTENGFPYGNPGWMKLPITNYLDGVQDFHQRNPNTGNAGSPQYNLELPAIDPRIFRARPSSFSYFGYNALNRKFYDSEKPYTKILFIVGQKEELNVGITHAHPFGKNCNIAFGFQRTRSTGFYQRQNTNNTSLDLNGWYRSPGKRYALMADVFWTYIDVNENGGIANDSDFEFATQLDRKIVAVNLDAAETRQRTREAWVKEYFSLGNIIDTIPDKNDTGKVRMIIAPSWAFVHTISISDEKYVYSDRDPQSGFYANVLNDTDLTHDSTYTYKLENGLWLERFQLHNGKQRSLFGKLGVRHETGEIFNDTIYKAFSNFLLDGSISFQRPDSQVTSVFSNANLKGWFVLNGYNKGDYFLHARVASFIIITAEQKRSHPDFIYLHYSGNHFSWVNDFYSSTQTDLLGSSHILLGRAGEIDLRAGLHNYEKPVYFDENYLPAQLAGSVNAVSTEAILLLGTKSFKTKTDFTWTKIPDSSPIRMPELLVRESVYGNFRLFKKALQLQVGADVTWFSSFYGYAYNPNISQFYIQNDKAIGNYPFIDAWAAIKVKPVRFFVKADHVNAGMTGRNYYLIPHYPQNDFALKFGLSWVFND